MAMAHTATAATMMKTISNSIRVLLARSRPPSIRNDSARAQRPRSRKAAPLAALALAIAPAALAEWVGEAIDLMGTRVSVELWHDDPAAGRALVETVLDDYRRIDRQMSTYRPDSPISRVNAEAA